MPIEIFTGLPGHGKTAQMVARLLQEVAKHEKGDSTARPLFAFGIDGLEPGPHVRVLEDPRLWNALDPNGVPTCNCAAHSEWHAHVIPDGSLIFVDEAWKWFGHLQEARGPNPPHVLALAEHRHRGIDFVWTTQMPSQLYPFARSLIADHHHTVRRFGTSMIDVFQWAELCEDVKSQSKRESALRKTTTLPRQAFGKYKSASEHTIKRNIPWRVVLLPACVLLAVALGWFAYAKLRPEAMAASVTGTEAPEAASADPALSPVRPGADHSSAIPHRSATAYAQATTPKIQEMPWTATAYEGMAVTAQPEVYCMKAGAGRDAQGDEQAESFTCITEQGTRYKMGRVAAYRLAEEGPAYNPYRVAPEPSNAPAAQGSPAPTGGARAPQAASGAGSADVQQATYGQFRSEGQATS